MRRETFGKPTIVGSGSIMQGGENNQQTFNAAERPGVGEQAKRPGSGEQAEPERSGLAELEELDRNIFVVYGRDDAVNSAVFELLRKLDLKPLEWEALVRGSDGGMTPMLSDVVINAPTLASAAVVILTPDDVVMLHPELRKPREEGFELRPSLQPRPNVLLELGIVLGVYPKRTLILEFGELRPIADLGGRNAVRFQHSTPIIAALRKIAGRLQEAGLPIDDSGSDWLDPKPFEKLRAYSRRPS